MTAFRDDVLGLKRKGITTAWSLVCLLLKCHGKGNTNKNPTLFADGVKELQSEVDRFCALPAEQQYSVLKTRVDYFQAVLSAAEHYRFLQDFKSTFR